MPDVHTTLNTEEMLTNWRDRDAKKQMGRVGFIIPRVYGGPGSRRDNRLGSVLQAAFGIPAHACYEDQGHDMKIVCRLDQFARFLIYRDSAGLCNGFKELKARLLDEPPRFPTTFDVTGNV